MAPVFAEALRLRDNRIASLEARLALCEQRPTMKYSGVFEKTKTYNVGEFVTCHGSVWHCKINNTVSEPGADPVSWQLAVKKGRDGR
jgi:hypothetical protein